jgi:hypothetical protein
MIYQVPFQTPLLKIVHQNGVTQPGVPLLPATYRRKHRIEPIGNDISSFLEAELNVSRLNDVHDWLWLVGLPSAARSLHYQVVKRRDIVVTEQLDLHLVWSSSTSSIIYIKPLPRFLLCPDFWRTQICMHPQLYQIALGFMLSYVALIEREADYNLAIHHGLLPREVTWVAWLALLNELVGGTFAQEKSFASDAASASSMELLRGGGCVNRRFHYGELRLGRLNWIYRITRGEFRGYLSGCTNYSTFMRENTNSLVTLFAYTTIVLSAMQVGLSTELLGNDYAFGMASSIFSVFSILAPLACIVAIMGVLAIIVVANLARTLRIRRLKQSQGVKV